MKQSKRETKNSDKIILDLCGGTGAWSRPYKDAGFDVRLITLPQFDIREAFMRGDGYLMFPMAKEYGDTMLIDGRKVYGVLAAPPCTMFSMARTTTKTPRDLRGAMEVVDACLRIIWECQYGGKRLAFWAMENPKARMRWVFGKPAMTFNPYDFGDAYRKLTDLWGNFNTEMKLTPVALNSNQLIQSKMNRQQLLKIPKDYVRDPNMRLDAIARSITHPGFAKSFYEANK